MRSIADRLSKDVPSSNLGAGFMIEDLKNIEDKILELKKSRNDFIRKYLDSGRAKIVYCVEGGNGYYHWIDGRLVVVLSEDKKFIDNLKFIRELSTYDEGTEYEPIGLDCKFLDPPEDMEMISDVGIDPLTKITPVIDIE